MLLFWDRSLYDVALRDHDITFFDRSLHNASAQQEEHDPTPGADAEIEADHGTGLCCSLSIESSRLGFEIVGG